jgi:hypothetical protein
MDALEFVGSFVTVTPSIGEHDKAKAPNKVNVFRHFITGSAGILPASSLLRNAVICRQDAGAPCATS